MAFKETEIAGLGTIKLYKRRGVRHIRLSVGHNGVRVTLPYWLPYQAGIDFVKQKQGWISAHLKPRSLLKEGQQIGKAHRLEFVQGPAGGRVSGRLQPNRIVVNVPTDLSVSSDKVQTAATKAAVRALKREAETLLPRRLRDLAQQHDFSFRSVEVKQLKSRWGSCNHRQEIVLNCYLMQLPWQLIDYVLFHELVHTRILAHGPRFWREMEPLVSNLTAIRKEMRKHQPNFNEILGSS